MPMINIKYDPAVTNSKELEPLANHIIENVQTATAIQEVFVYLDSAEVTIGADPVEVLIEMSASKVKDLEGQTAEIVTTLKAWKQENGFALPINLSLIPVHWKFVPGI